MGDAEDLPVASDGRIDQLTSEEDVGYEQLIYRVSRAVTHNLALIGGCVNE